MKQENGHNKMWIDPKITGKKKFQRNNQNP